MTEFHNYVNVALLYNDIVMLKMIQVHYKMSEIYCKMVITQFYSKVKQLFVTQQTGLVQQHNILSFLTNSMECADSLLQTNGFLCK